MTPRCGNDDGSRSDPANRIRRVGLVRTKGSHRQFHHPVKPGTVTISGNPSKTVPPGTLNSILKQAGLK